MLLALQTSLDSRKAKRDNGVHPRMVSYPPTERDEEPPFLSLLSFVERYAPDEVTRAVARLARQDEARHVAFGLSHLERHAASDPGLLERLARAIERRHDALMTSAGLNDAVFDALVLIAAGEASPTAIARGWAAVGTLQAEMQAARTGRLLRLGFASATADRLSALHTRNFM